MSFSADDYPRPQLRRDGATSLDGAWDFALDPTTRWHSPAAVTWDRTIQVPFAPETPLSGIHETDFLQACWYRRELPPVTLAPNERLVLHFGAVDFAATVWVNDELAGSHQGGYTPFSCDLSGFARAGGPLTVVVRAADDPHDMAQPRGKQDWRREPHMIWYPRTTGIWQTVWLERRPATAITRLHWFPEVDAWQIGFELTVADPTPGLRVAVTLTAATATGDVETLAADTFGLLGSDLRRVIQLPDPGIENARKQLMWSPDNPILIEAELRLLDEAGTTVDRVESYCGLRSVGTDGDRFMLNGRPCVLRLVLDQGYWPESGLTPPSPAALRQDVELARAMGFNGVRKHQKIEDPRYLYWADRLGLLVWEELPSAYRFSRDAVNRLARVWTATIERDLSHPCIITWVPFNESWGVPDLPLRAEQRAAVTALYYLTKALDPTRPVVDNDGWESGPTDLICVHDYDYDAARLGRRYSAADRETVLASVRPERRRLRLAPAARHEQPWLLSEFGGIAYTAPEQRDESWGYDRADTAAEFQASYAELMAIVHQLPFAGYCYTQFADTYQEKNGLLTADRTPKIPLEAISLATRGPLTPREIEQERQKRQMAGLGSDD